MLRRLVQQQQPKFLTTYTRNPAILQMIQRVSSELYPIVPDEELRNLASQMQFASQIDAIYHLNRYDEGGLFRGDDPADSPFANNEMSLKNQFNELSNVRNALIVAARVRKA